MKELMAGLSRTPLAELKPDTVAPGDRVFRRNSDGSKTYFVAVSGKGFVEESSLESKEDK